MLWRPDGGIGCIASHLDNEYLAIAPVSGNVLELLNFSSQQVVATFEIPCTSEVVNMAFSRDGGKLFVITGVSDSKLIAFDVMKKELLFSEDLKDNSKNLVVNPSDDNLIALYGDDGLKLCIVNEIMGSYSILFEPVVVESEYRYDDYEVSDDDKMAATTLGNSITFVQWMPFNYLVFGNRQGNVLEANVMDGKNVNVLRKSSLKKLYKGNAPSSSVFPTSAAIGLGTFIVSTSVGTTYWFPMTNFSKAPSVDTELVDYSIPLQITDVKSHISCVLNDPLYAKLLIGTAGEVFSVSVEVQERNIDENEMDMNQTEEDEVLEPIIVESASIGTFQQGAMLCSKPMFVPYDNKNSISVIMTGSHDGNFSFWKQPFVESENISSNSGIKRSIPKQSKCLFTGQIGFGEDRSPSVICSMEVLPFKGKPGTALISFGTDAGWVEVWEVAGVLPEDDEEDGGEGGEDSVKIHAHRIACRRFYDSCINVMSSTIYPSVSGISNLFAFGSALNDIVYALEVSNTPSGFAFDVKCTFKVESTVAGVHFEGSSLFVSGSDGQFHKFPTATAMTASAITFPLPEFSWECGLSKSFSSAILKNTEPTIIAIGEESTSFNHFETGAKKDFSQSGEHDSIIVCCAASPNGKFVATGCVDGSLYIWEKLNMNKFELINKIHLHSDAVITMSFTTDSSLLYSCGIDGSTFLSTVAEAGRVKNDAKLMKLNDKATSDEEFLNSSPDPESRTWLKDKEEKVLVLMKIENAARVDGIKSSLDKIAEKQAVLLEENEKRDDLERMDVSEFVIDIKGRDNLIVNNEAESDTLRSSFHSMNLWNELSAARAKKTCWDSMDMQARPVYPLLGSNSSGMFVTSLSVRKYTAEESNILEKVIRLRSIEARCQQAESGIVSKLPGGKSRCAWSTAVQGCPAVTSWVAMDGARWPCEDIVQMLVDKEIAEAEAKTKKKSDSAEEDEEEEQVVIQDDEEDDQSEKKSDFNENDIFNLLYPPQSVRTQIQKRFQIILMTEVSRIVCAKFNTHFDKLASEKDDVIGTIESRNARITVILGELKTTDTLIQPKWKNVEIAGSAVKVFDDEVESKPYESEKERAARLLEEEEKRRKEAEKDGEDVMGRALIDMMNGVLSVKKDTLSDEGMVRPAWMDEIDPKDMSELQLKELDEFDDKARLFAEEQAKYKKALEMELKKLKTETIEALQAFDEKVKYMAGMKVAVQKELLTQELYIARIAHSMAKRDQLWNSLKKNEQMIDSTRVQRNSLRAKIEEFGVDVDKVKTKLNNAQEDERQMDKGFNRNIQDVTNLTFDLDTLKIFKALFRKRNFPMGADDDELDGEASEVMGLTKGSKSGAVSQAGKSKSKGGSSMANSKQKGSKAPGGSKAAAGLGPMQEAAKALNSEEQDVDLNDPFYHAIVQKEKEKKIEQSQIPLLSPLDMEVDCPENFTVDQFTWSKLQELRNSRIEKEIEAKVLSIEYADLRRKLDQLCNEEAVMVRCIGDLRDSREGTLKSLKELESDLEIVVCLRQGNDEVDKDAVISNYSDALLIPVEVVNKFNSRIKDHGKEKIGVLSKIKQFRRKINIIDWNASHLSMQSHHYEEYFTDLQLLKVTRDLQQVIRDGSDEGQTKVRLEKVAARKEFLQKNADVKVGKLRKFNEKLERTLKDKVDELATLNDTINNLRMDVAQRKSVQRSRDDARGSTGDVVATAAAKMKKVVQRRQLVDTARAQAEEIDYLRQELDKMRQRTFPSFAKAHKK